VEPLKTHTSKGKFAKGNKLGIHGGRKSFKDGGKGGCMQRANQLLEDALPEVVKSVIESALAGDMAACKMIFDKKLASLKSVEVQGIDISKLPRMIVEASVIDAEVITVDGKDIKEITDSKQQDGKQPNDTHKDTNTPIDQQNKG